MKKIIVVLGPTASGKSDLAVKIAKKLDGEIISADSRQVYKGMDIGTGKVTPDTKNSKKYVFTHKGIPHHCIDVASPKRRFTVAQYRRLAIKAINKIFKKNKIPIICGGTAFYIYSLINGISIPEVKPDWKLRKKLEKKNSEELFQMLKQKDPRRAQTIDKKNKRRLIRAIEITEKLNKIPRLQKKPLPYPVLIIGIKKEKEELKRLIRNRLLKRLKKGMIDEVKRLKKQGLSWKRLEEFGLEYKYIALYLQGKIRKQEMIEKLQKEIERFAKRQMTWFKKDKRIHWIKNEQEFYYLMYQYFCN